MKPDSNSSRKGSATRNRPPSSTTGRPPSSNDLNSMKLMMPPDSHLVKKVKCQWVESVVLLQDLRSKKSFLHQQLISEIVALKQESEPGIDAEELIGFKRTLQDKIKMIESSANKPGDILGVTGFTSVQDVNAAMFQLLGIIELVQHAYAECDAAQSKSAVTKGRLVGYLQMISRLKRPGTASS